MKEEAQVVGYQVFYMNEFELETRLLPVKFKESYLGRFGDPHKSIPTIKEIDEFYKEIGL